MSDESFGRSIEADISRFLDSAWNAAVYVGCLYFLGAAFWKALLIGSLMLICVYIGYGSRWLMRGGVALLVIALLVFLDVLPEPDEWRNMIPTSWTTAS